MNIVLSIFTSKAFKDFILPKINNTNYSVILEKEIYGISKDIRLNFDVIEGEWRILSGDEYYLNTTANGKVDKITIKNGLKFEVVCCDGTVIRISVADNATNFLQTQKFIIKSKSVSIGSSSGNDIVCKASFISHSHAKLSYNKSNWYIEDLSQNGVFVNSVRVKVNTQLKYGDFINIVGLKIVFLNEMIAVCDDGSMEIDVNPSALAKVSWNFEEEKEDNNDIVEKEYYNRAPRVIRKLFTDPIEIEAPPAPKAEDDRSLLTTIGPSFTMAIPMLLGCLLMIYSSRSSGGSSSAFMFTGLITAVSSAMLGSFWGVINYRNSKKSRAKEEKKRFEAYSDYLMKTAENIKEKAALNKEIMNEIYPSAEDCSSIAIKVKENKDETDKM